MSNDQKLKLFDELLNKSLELVKKIKEIEDDESYRAIFTAASLRGVNYEGPTWAYEVKDLEEIFTKM